MTDLEKAFCVLGVSPGDDDATIRKAWRALVRSYHPDTARHDPVGANKRLTDINVAFDAVCACTPEDIEKLQAAAAHRASLAERARRDILARQRQARDKVRAKQRQAQKASRAASPEPVHTSEAEAETTEQPTPVQETPVVMRTPSTRNREAVKSGITALVARAERGFLDAIQVCSGLAHTPARSSYL